MNSVAVSKVATIMSNNLSTAQATNPAPSKDFDAVLQKSITAQAHQNHQEKVLKSVKGKNVDLETFDKKNVVDKEEDAINYEVVQPLNTSQPIAETKDVDDIEKEVIQKIASSLGISEDELNEMMTSLNLTFMDLATNKGLQTLFNEAFGLENEVELLTNPVAFEVFKEIKNIFRDVLTEKGFKLDDFIKQFEEMQSKVVDQEEKPVNVVESNNQVMINQQSTKISENQSTIVASTVNVTTTVEQKMTVEVVDLREQKPVVLENQPVEVQAPKDKELDSKNSKNNNSSTQNEFENMFQHSVSQKVEVVTAQGIKEIIYQTTSAKDIINQVATQVKVAITDLDTTMSFQLKPENLGKIAFSITSQNGVLTGHFVAESNAVKETIEMNLGNLKQTLNDQGIKLDEVKVVVGNTNQFFEQNNPSKNFNHFSKNKRRRSFEEDNSIEGVGQKMVDLREAMIAQELKNQDHLVDYSA